MCVSPVKIKNPYRGLAKIGLNRYHDCSSAFIYVPCGHCPDCKARKQSDVVQRVSVELMSHHAFFFTLTYDNEHLPKVTFTDDVIDETTGEVHTNTDTYTYADHKHVVRMFKRIRKNNEFGRPFKYMVVSERGSQRHRPHFHGFIFIPKEEGDKWHVYRLEQRIYEVLKEQWKMNKGTRKNPDYEPLFQHRTKITSSGIKSNFDCHYVNPIASDGGECDVAFYVTKYMFKDDDFERKLKASIHFRHPDREEEIWSTIKSRRSNSLGLGLDSDYSKGFSRSNISTMAFHHLEQHILSSNPFPTFANLVDGKLYPLAIYYRNNGNIYTLEHLDSLYKRYNFDGNDWNHLDISAPDVDAYRQKESQYRKKSRLIISHEDSDLD